MADRGPVDLDVLAAPQFGIRAATWPLGGLGLAMGAMGGAVLVLAPALWKVAVLFGVVGAATMALAGLIWHRTGPRGPVLVLRAGSLGLPHLAAGKAPAPTVLRWPEIEALALTGPAAAPEALLVVLTADAARARGAALPGDPPDPGHRTCLRLPLGGLSETPRRIGESVGLAAEGAGMVRGAAGPGLARFLPDGAPGPGQGWGWPGGS